MTEGLEQRVAKLETQIAVMDVHHIENVRRLTLIEVASNANGAKLDELLIRTAEQRGQSNQREKFFGSFGQIVLAAISGGILGQAFRWLWPPR